MLSFWTVVAKWYYWLSFSKVLLVACSSRTKGSLWYVLRGPLETRRNNPSISWARKICEDGREDPSKIEWNDRQWLDRYENNGQSISLLANAVLQPSLTFILSFVTTNVNMVCLQTGWAESRAWLLQIFGLRYYEICNGIGRQGHPQRPSGVQSRHDGLEIVGSLWCLRSIAWRIHGKPVAYTPHGVFMLQHLSTNVISNFRFAWHLQVLLWTHCSAYRALLILCRHVEAWFWNRTFNWGYTNSLVERYPLHSKEFS